MPVNMSNCAVRMTSGIRVDVINDLARWGVVRSALPSLTSVMTIVISEPFQDFHFLEKYHSFWCSIFSLMRHKKVTFLFKV